MKRLIPLIALMAGPVLAQDYPLTIRNKFGETVIEAAPQRVATLNYGGADNVLAFGFQPLSVREWFGPYENTVWPWARDLLTGEPVVLSGTLDLEKIAAIAPDVIIATRSGITEAEYEKLSAIAPVVAVPPGHEDYDLNWRDRALLTGQALGRIDAAQDAMARVDRTLEALHEDHPDWAGKTFALMTYYDGSLGLYTPTDSSVQFFIDMGLTLHPRVAEISPEGQFYTSISEEVLPELDADVIFWFASPGMAEIEALAPRRAMRAPREGREVYLTLTSEANGALSYGSVLSLIEATRSLAPMIDAALDGDPATEVPLE